METNVLKEKSDYGNWVSLTGIRILYAACIIVAVMMAAGFYFLHRPYILYTGIVSLLMLITCLIYSHWCRGRLSFTGGRLIEKSQKFLIDHLFWDGQGNLLDVGCGNGSLSVMCARRYEDSRVMGVDSWGKEWEYGKNECETNASIEGLSLRMNFKHEELSHLSFTDESFDAVVSSFAFSKDRSVSEKKDLITESLRVLKKGGSFAFQDKFAFARYYGDMEHLVDELKASGITEVHYMRNAEKICGFIPLLMFMPWMFGGTGLLYGVK